MGKETKRKQLHYRQASLLNPTGKTLQELVEEALAKLNHVSDRFELLTNESPDDDWRRFINTHRAAMGMQFGNLVHYATGHNRHVIAIDESADEVDIEQITPPDADDGRRREFLESILYYGIKDNHVIVLQSMALRSRELEEHFNWLLRVAGLIDELNAVFINSFAPAMTHERLEHTEVKSVKVGTPLIDPVGLVPEKGNDPRLEAKTLRYHAFGEGLNVLKQVAGNRISELSWDELQASTNLEVYVEVTYKRQTDEKSQQLLNRLTTALRHAGDEEIRIELKDGGVIVGSDLQVKAFRGISAYNGLMDPEDVFRTMYDWLVECLEKGLIDAD